MDNIFRETHENNIYLVSTREVCILNKLEDVSYAIMDVIFSILFSYGIFVLLIIAEVEVFLNKVKQFLYSFKDAVT